MASGGGHILVVDDNENMRELLRRILAPRHDVIVAADGAAALALLNVERFDVVLTDVRMPDLDGFELVRRVKGSWPSTQVIMATAFASVPSAVEAMREGAYDYLVKPFDPDDVALVIARALEHHRDEAAVRLSGLARDENLVVEPPPVPRALTPRTSERLSTLSYREALADAHDRGSSQYLIALLRTFRGNVSRAAERAGLERESLHRLLRRYGIRAEAFRTPVSRGGGA